jgi:hypothetical protein
MKAGSRPATRAGLPGLERELIRSEHGTAEFHLVRDLWRLAREEITVERDRSASGRLDGAHVRPRSS